MAEEVNISVIDNEENINIYISEYIPSVGAIPKLNNYVGDLPLDENKNITLTGSNLDLITSITTSNPFDDISYTIIDQGNVSVNITATALGGLDLIINNITYSNYFNVKDMSWNFLNSTDYANPSITAISPSWVQTSDGIVLGNGSTGTWQRNHRFNDFIVNSNQVCEVIFSSERLTSDDLFYIALVDVNATLNPSNNFGVSLNKIGVVVSHERGGSEATFIGGVTSNGLSYSADANIGVASSNSYNWLRLKISKDNVELYRLNPHDSTDLEGVLMKSLPLPTATKPDNYALWFNNAYRYKLRTTVKAIRVY